MADPETPAEVITGSYEIRGKRVIDSPQGLIVTGETAAGRGRPKGAGALIGKDAPLVERIHELRTASKGLSVEAAAEKVVADAAGGGTQRSKIKRLAERYSVKYLR